MDIKLSVKILIGLAAIFMIPLLFIMLLPSLVFETDGLDTASGDTLNDTSLIMENIAATESCIEEILREKHNALLEEIRAEADSLEAGCEYSITDAFADYRTFVQMTLQRDNVEHVGKIIFDIGAGLFFVGNDIQTRQAHDMVNAQRAGMTHIGAQDFDERFISFVF